MKVKNAEFSNQGRFSISKSKFAMSLDYIFGKRTSKALDFNLLDFQYSRRTGSLRYVMNRKSKEILFTIRPNGSIAPTIAGIRFILIGSLVGKPKPRWVVTVIDEVSEFVSRGKSVFCKHVVSCSEELRAGEDVVVSNQRGEILAVGRSVIPASAMKQFKRGVAVKVRQGVDQNGPSTVI